MKKIFNKKSFLFLLFFSFFGIGLFFIILNLANDKKLTVAQADASNNVTGFAWASSTGWISFNSTDCNIDDDANFEGSNEGTPVGSTPAPVGCPPSGTAFNYGVNIDSSGNFSGTAWSSNLGWLSFDRADTGDPPGAPYQAAGNIARLDMGTGDMTGWARFLSFKATPDTGEGWVKFAKDAGDTGPAYGVKATIATGDFSGWAWHGGNDGLGWISFNGDDCNHAGGVYTGAPANCPPNGTPYFAYKVHANLNTPPSGALVTVGQRTDGSGIVFVKFNADDNENSVLSARVAYTSSACNFSMPLDPTLDTASSSATNPGIAINNASVYQISNIITAPGANTIGLDWFSKTDMPAANEDHCLVIVYNDGSALATSAPITFTVDNIKPAQPGNLSIGGRTGTSVTLNFGSQSSDTYFKEYKIFYRTGNTLPTEADSVFTSASLGSANYGGTTNAVVTGLTLHQLYSFTIYAYDNYGNKSSSTSFVATTTNNIPVAQINTPADNAVLDSGTLCSHILTEQLNWTFVDPGDSQTAYQIQIRDNTPPGPTGAWGDIYDFTSSTYTNEFMNFTSVYHNIRYGKTYDYQIRVRDSYGEWSAWSTTYGTFSTPAHEYPIPYFIYTPKSFSLGEPVRFQDNPLSKSKYYDNSNTQHNCNDANCLWVWATSSPATISNPAASSTNIIFNSNPVGNVTLTITNDGFSCSTTTNLTAKKNLPSWIEKK